MIPDERKEHWLSAIILRIALLVIVIMLAMNVSQITITKIVSTPSYIKKGGNIDSGEIELLSGGGDYPPPPIGDWVITNDTYIENETIILTGNLTILEGGNLTFHNVTLKMNCTENGTYHIEVKGGGGFFIYDNDNDNLTTYDASIITSNTPDGKNRYKFNVTQNATLIMRNSELHECGYSVENKGLDIQSDKIIIDHSLLSNNYYGIVLLLSSSAVITNNIIQSNELSGIYIQRSFNTSIINNTIINNFEGMGISFSSNITIVGNNISNNGDRGIGFIDSSDSVIENNKIIDNQYDGINYQRSSNVTIAYNTVVSTGFRGIYLLIPSSYSPPFIIGNTLIDNENGIWFYLCLNANVNIINTTVENSTNYDFYLWSSNPTDLNTTFNKTKVYFKDAPSILTVQWYMHIKVVDLNDKIISGADIEVRDINDDIIYDGITGSDGYSRWIVSTEYIQNDTDGDHDGEDPGEKIFFTPHNITVSKDGYTVYADPEPFMNESKEVVVKLPIDYTTYTITKEPVQGNVTVDGLEYPVPAVLSWINGEIHTISVNSPENGSPNTRFTFDYWDDLGAQTHDVLVGAVDTVITACYYNQYKPIITLNGTDGIHTVTAYYTQDKTPINSQGNYYLWEEWVDEGTALFFDLDATGSSGTERRHTYEDFGIDPWISVNSPFSAAVVYYHQYNASITTTGLVPSHTATITAIVKGVMLNNTTNTYWNDWVDADSVLNINETIYVSVTEQYHTIDACSWTVSSPIDAVVNYYHQYLVTITTDGLDPAYSAAITFTQHNMTYNPPTNLTWWDWADYSSTLSIEDTVLVSGKERYHTIDSVDWFVDSPLSVLVNYYHQYLPSVALEGLDPIHNVSAFATSNGIPYIDIEIFDSWSGWVDEGTAVSFDSDATGSSGTERRHTYEDFGADPWISVNSPFSAAVIYYHQYNASITTTGLVPSHTATITATVKGVMLNNTTNTYWNDWVDADSALNINETINVSVTERYHTIDACSWTVNSPIDATVGYYHQYLATITTTGLDSAYPATLCFVQHSITGNPTTSSIWSDWADATSPLNVTEILLVSERERYRSFDTISWTMDAALAAVVNYTHQYKPVITLKGTDDTHTVGVTHTKDLDYHNDTSVFGSWSDWVDLDTSLVFDEYTSGSLRRHTVDTRTWKVNSAFDANISYKEETKDGGEEPNYKPLIALIFALTLLAVGTYVSSKKPLRFKGTDNGNKIYTWLIIVLPFVIVEVITGIVSFRTRLLSVPPLVGIGMAVDLIILIGGLTIFLSIYRKKSPSGQTNGSESIITSHHRDNL